MRIFYRLKSAPPAQPTAPASALHQQASIKPQSNRLRPRWLPRLGWRLWAKTVVAIAALGSLAIAGLFLTYSLRFPDPLALAHKQHAPVIHILARDGSELAVRGIAADYIPLDLMPQHMIHAVLATEDRRFFEHWGVDPWGMARAAATNLRAGRFAQGGSTLSQQLAKNLFLSGERKLGRKIEELTFAIWLELRLSKRDILELYLNRVYFGGGAYGIEAASQRYFGKSVRDVSLPEAAVLAGLLKAPSKYSPANNPHAARARARVVLSNMVANATLSEAASNVAADNPTVFVSTPQKATTGLEYAVEYALERMPPIRGPGNIEVFVTTTLDAKLQRSAHHTVARHLDTYGTQLQANQASILVMDHSGGIRALVGGRSYEQSQFNRAIKARRQPGSAFKPIVYLAAIESGLTPQTISYDLPLSVKGWSPRNDNGAFQGAMTLRQALAQSVNTIAVRMHLDLPKGRVVETARRLGIASPLQDAPALALGASEVSLLELTQAYTVLGNGGYRVAPHIIDKVQMASGDVLYQRAYAQPVMIVKPAHTQAMTEMLGEVLTTGTGKRAALKGRPSAGKTGTTQDFRDAWFVGYTDQLTAGVWVGNDGAEPMNRVMGGSLPARIWHDVMASAQDDPAAVQSAAKAANLQNSLPIP